MQPGNKRAAAFFTLATFTATACSSDVTGPVSQREIEPVVSVADDGLTPFLNQKDRSRFYCYTANRLPSGMYMHRTLWLRFPKRFDSPSGATQVVLIEWPDQNGKRFAAASCTIPDTREALTFLLEKHFLQDPKTIRVPGINRDVLTGNLRGPNSQLAPPTESRKYQLWGVIVVANDGSFWSIGGGHFSSISSWSGQSVPSWSGEPNPDPAAVEPSATAPEPIPQAFYDELNRAEKLLCLEGPAPCLVALNDAHRASTWAREQTPQLGTAEADNLRDALRHTLWQALLTCHTDADYAQAWGNAHESSSTSAASTAMDQHNNAIGREIGANCGDIEAAVLAAQPRLQTAP